MEKMQVAIEELGECQKKLATMMDLFLQQIQNIPQMNAIATGFMEVADIVLEDGAATRNVIRNTLEEEMFLADSESLVDTKFPGNNEIAELNEFSPLVAVARASKKTTKKAIEKAEFLPIPQIPQLTTTPKSKSGLPALSLKDLEKFVGKTPKEIATELNRGEKDHNEKRKPAEFLDEAEKAVAKESLATLDRQWREKAGWKVKTTDFAEIGTLDDAQVQLPRHLVRRIIRNRRVENYVSRLAAEGRETKKCELCGRTYPIDIQHNCFIATGWGINTKKDGIPATKEMVVSQIGKGGIQIRPKIDVDSAKLNENYQKFARYKLVIDDSKRDEPRPQGSALEQNTSPAMEVDAGNSETVLVGGSSNVVVDVNLATSPMTDNPEVLIYQDPSTKQFFRLSPC